MEAANVKEEMWRGMSKSIEEEAVVATHHEEDRDRCLSKRLEINRARWIMKGGSVKGSHGFKFRDNNMT